MSTDYIDYLTNGYVPEASSRRRIPSVRDGRVPAEALTPQDRARLVAELVTAGDTDQQIADLTRMTLYTTARIRERLGLQPNKHMKDAAA